MRMPSGARNPEGMGWVETIMILVPISIPVGDSRGADINSDPA
jgi:hypothetical protein